MTERIVDGIIHRASLFIIFIVSALDALVSPEGSANVIIQTLLDSHLQDAFPLDDDTLRLMQRALYNEKTK